MLARGFEPRPLSERVADWERQAGGPTGTEILPHPPGVRLVRRYAASEWQPTVLEGEFVERDFALTIPEGACRISGARLRLFGRGREFPPTAGGEGVPGPGEIRCERTRLTLVLPRGAAAVPPTILRIESPDGVPREHALASDSWRAGEAPGTFWIDAPRGTTLDRPGSVRLFAELARVEDARALGTGEYRVEKERVLLRWTDGSPPAVELVAQIEHGRSVNGQWQLRLGGYCATGLPVWSGERQALECDLPPASQLTFRFVHAAAADSGPVAIRVRLDEALLFERRMESGAWREARHVEIPLPPEGRRHARLSFEVEGAAGLGAFFTPTIGPIAHGRPGARPWDARPDLVLFLVDTLRADSLALQGGDPALAPHLNRFAERCLRFPNARSNAAWTLPSISSLLTGLHPAQHGATDEDLSLSALNTTIAERLEESGYRTGAITDGSFFAPIFGLDQGFEWFSQHDPDHWDLDRTLADACDFLAQDDGRPVFLVVHTYRVHQPYRVGPDEDPGEYEALLARVAREAGVEDARPASRLAALAGHEAELRALYSAGVRDLDAGLGGFLAWLEERNYFEHGTLVLTSDHGEALGENHDFFHGGHLWEPKLRVPLLMRGPGIVAREVPYLAGPIDLTPTFAELAGLTPEADWAGTSLLGLDHQRPSFAFQVTRKSRQVAIREENKKVILTPDEARLAEGRCEEAFDLASDPQEARNLAQESAWPAELTRRLAPRVRAWLGPRFPREQAGITPDLRRELDGLGYGGGEE